MGELERVGYETRVFCFPNLISLGSILQRGTARICHRRRKAGFSHELHWHRNQIRREKKTVPDHYARSLEAREPWSAAWGTPFH